MILLHVSQPVLILGVVAMCLMAIGIAIFVAAYQRKFTQQQLAYQQELLQVSVEAQERERTRIARELHDGVGAMLSAIKLLVRRLPRNDVRTDIQKDLEEMLAQTIHEVRTLSRGLSSLQVQRIGLGNALNNYCRLVNEAEDIEVRFVNKSSVKSTNFRAELSIYRIAQELIYNAIQHAQATYVSVSLSVEQDYLCLQVEDDGQGFNIATAEPQGNGLLNIRSRLYLLQGSISQKLLPKPGACLVVRIPLYSFTQITT